MIEYKILYRDEKFIFYFFSTFLKIYFKILKIKSYCS